MCGSFQQYSLAPRPVGIPRGRSGSEARRPRGLKARFPGVGHPVFSGGCGIGSAGSGLINPAGQRLGGGTCGRKAGPSGTRSQAADCGCPAGCPLAPGWGCIRGVSSRPGVWVKGARLGARDSLYSLARASRSAYTTPLLCSAPPAVPWPAKPSRRRVRRG